MIHIQLPSGFDTIENYAHQIIQFLKIHQHWWNFRTNYILVDNQYNHLIPSSWQAHLEKCSEEELIYLGSKGLSSHQEKEWPKDLIQFIKSCKELALPRQVAPQWNAFINSRNSFQFK